MLLKFRRTTPLSVETVYVVNIIQRLKLCEWFDMTDSGMKSLGQQRHENGGWYY
jgi:hypothetical protein